MVLTAVFILGITAISLMLLERYKIPTPISVLSIAYALSYLTGHTIIDVNDANFDQIILVLLPVLITTDVLMLRFDDVKKNALSLFYVAVVSVVLSILLGAYAGAFLLSDYNLPFIELIMLFCMITATDPVAVISVLGSSKLPHKLKFIAEGESLANDATALIVFSICLSVLAMMKTGSTTVADITLHSVMVVVGAVAIGLSVGVLGLALLSMSRNKIAETAMMMFIGYLAFELAEMFHWSGILAIIVSVMTANTIITRRIERDDCEIANEENIALLNAKGKVRRKGVWALKRLEDAIKDKSNHEDVKDFIGFISVLATTVLFVSMVAMINMENLFTYWKEILGTFFIVTISRMMMMSKFAFLSNSTDKMQNINVRWWSILSLAGVKGGLSILMLHMSGILTNNELFEAIVIGNIVLSTFIYPPIMLTIIKLYKTEFTAESISK